MTDRNDREAKPHASLPTQEKYQPDPLLQMTTGHMGVGGVTLFAVIAVAILTVVLYGLNEHAVMPSPPATTAAASKMPAAGGHGGAVKTAPQTANKAKG